MAVECVYDNKWYIGTAAEMAAFTPPWANGARFWTTDTNAVYTWNGAAWVLPTPAIHGTTHEDGGSDEIDVTGLSGLLADDQNPVAHAASHETGGGDIIDTLTNLSLSGFLNLGPYTQLTINAGIITATGSYHKVETQGGAATDDLDTINGGSAGDLLLLSAADSAHTVVCKDETGNLSLAGDFSLTHNRDKILLVNMAGVLWAEISRSDNTA